jgi:hypothetical protein
MSAPALLDVKTNVHEETGHEMVDLDESTLGGCQGQCWLAETAGRTEVLYKERGIMPVDHVSINTPRIGERKQQSAERHIYMKAAAPGHGTVEVLGKCGHVVRCLRLNPFSAFSRRRVDNNRLSNFERLRRRSCTISVCVPSCGSLIIRSE